MNGQKPEYRAVVSDKKGDKTYYKEIGAGWKVAHDGISVTLRVLPPDGKFVLFPNTPKQ